MNYFTPELGPPLVGAEGEEWKKRVTHYLEGLRSELDTKMEAFLSKKEQIGDIWSEQSGTATAAGGSSETMVFQLSTGAPFSYRTPFVMPMVGQSGWSVGVVGAGQTSVTVSVNNHSGTGTNAVVTLRYF